MRPVVLILSLFAAVAASCPTYEFEKAATNHSRYIAPRNPSAPSHLPPGVNRSVLIVGATPSGLRAALELASKGYRVHVTEARDWLGGDYGPMTFPVQTGNTTVLPRLDEGIFFNAFQTKDLLTKMSVSNKSVIWSDNVIVAHAGQSGQFVVTAAGSPSAFYLKLNTHAVESGCIGAWDLFQSYSLEGSLAGMKAADMLKYENASLKDLQTLLKSKQSFYDCFLRPFASGTGLDDSRLSAYEALERMLYYVTVDPASPHHGRIVLRLTNDTTNLMSLVVHTLAAYNVSFEKNYQVTRFYVDGSQGRIVRDFDRQGVQYDHFVLAGNLAETSAILDNTRDLNTGYPLIFEPLETAKEKFGNLRKSASIKVVKLLLQHSGTFSDDEVVAVGYQNVERITVLQRFNGSQSQTATLLQVVVRNCSDTDCSADNAWTTLKAQIIDLYPEFTKAPVLHTEVTDRKDAVNLEVHQNKFRDRVDYLLRLGIKNLVLAGNWLNTNGYPSDRLERDLSIGVEAANEILFRDKVLEAGMWVPLSQGTGR